MDTIKEVWSSNLEEEMRKICDIVEKFPYIGMDTEFPGVTVQPMARFANRIDYQYGKIRCNVNELKIIQIGLTFTDENGNLPDGISTWQFNFQFDLKKDQYAQDGINLLQHSGIDFEKFKKDGINVSDFAELLTTSGVVLSDSVTWISYHSCYDFVYFYKLLSNLELPKKVDDFLDNLLYYFPVIYDIKFIAKAKISYHGGLQDLADLLNVKRTGPQHQAGSDSLLTSQTFFKFKEQYFQGSSIEIYKNKIYDFVPPPKPEGYNNSNHSYL
ncbi:pop2 isoform e [Anaeramoeba ignava]|uniref:poly(A)-specific ribonuclease n=1 Tax=Anaeramoeba ignava TaxID=1746090 RepID=A0A9Q0LV23_ANAIG|nr:pop2 isoform e [Anaeramoeba ignava]